ncbi:RICIN domain-containing protein [Agrilactobacillus yilanensis]|uniref:RICIN domain-containing protein n=1 Tax=Agrilactobacillus yilanensis TaxID=2485997 RepID=A0ABW4J5K0_9LACO|nr:RICIN domain-containing protein [Agrilactobacillus yilanensis]
MNSTYLITGNIILLGAATLILGPRFYKNYRRKIDTANAHMIQNVSSGKVIRPRDAQITDGTPIIQYTPQNWECTTWQFIDLGNSEYLFKDLYTQKSFQPVSTPVDGVELEQQAIGGNPLQHWIIHKLADEAISIQLKGTNLFITSPDNKVNSRLQLRPYTGSSTQQWHLKEQRPIV